MILTGSKIKEEEENGSIMITPFHTEQVNPNSYDYRLGSILKIYESFDGIKSVFKEIKISKEGYVLEPSKMYLGHTKEVIGSSKYAMSLIGKSSIGRYGLFLQASANLGHTTSKHQWTLEMVATQPIRVYSGMIIGQVSFWKNFGDIKKYNSKYSQFNHPQEAFISLFDW